MSDRVRPECISEIASILAKGFLRCRKSRQVRPPEISQYAQNGLDSGAEPSRHVSVVNAERTEEN